MARKRKKARKARRRTSKRPIVLQLPPPRKKARARRRNPVAATVVNPSRRRIKRRRRRRKSNPSLVKGIKSTFKTKTLLPIMIGGGLGVVGISASQKWIAPRLSPKWQALAEATIGIAGLPVVNKLYNGAGPYFTGFMVGSALTTVIKPLLPWGDWGDDIDAMIEDDDLGAIELIGGVEDDYSGFGEAEADQAAAGDNGLEGIVSDGAESHLVDGLGVLPPVRIPQVPIRLLRRLQQAGLLWLLRLGIPHAELVKLLSLSLPHRRGALLRLRKRYVGMRRKAHKRHGRRFKQHPYVVGHPRRRQRAHIRHPIMRKVRAKAMARRRFGDISGFDDEGDGADVEHDMMAAS
jgi:hypothetical protein